MTQEAEYASMKDQKKESSGWFAQTGDCFMNSLRMFFRHRSWMVLPMAVLLAAFVGFFMKDDFRKTMEGTLKGIFVLACICIWNGSFSSIQAISREREDHLPEYCPGSRVSPYAFGHILFQLVLCIVQTLLILLVIRISGVEYQGSGLITSWFVVDFGITLLLIMYAADLTALWISSVCRTTKASMTILPFVLVFEILLSGTLLSLPMMLEPVSFLTVSRPGINALGSLTDVNEQPIATIPEMLSSVEGTELRAHVTLGQVLDILTDTDNRTVEKVRSIEVGGIQTIGEVMEGLLEDERFQELRDTNIFRGLTFGTLLSELDDARLLDKYKDKEVGVELTLGEIIDVLATNNQLKGFRNEGITFKTTVGDVMELMGREKTTGLIEEKVKVMYYNPDYEHSAKNAAVNWLHLLVYTVVFAVLTILTLTIVAAWQAKRQTGGSDQA